jgi:hypothetical protein
MQILLLILPQELSFDKGITMINIPNYAYTIEDIIEKMKLGC